MWDCVFVCVSVCVIKCIKNTPVTCIDNVLTESGVLSICSEYKVTVQLPCHS